MGDCAYQSCSTPRCHGCEVMGVSASATQFSMGPDVRFLCETMLAGHSQTKQQLSHFCLQLQCGCTHFADDDACTRPALVQSLFRGECAESMLTSALEASMKATRG